MAQHSRINTDIKPVREIDIENASKEELIEYLCQTIHYEVEKGEDADCDLIRECSDWLGELTADKIVFTPEELDAKLEAIKTGKYTNTAKPHKPSHIHHVTKRKVFARVTILVASLVLLSFLSLSALAMHAGYSCTWEYISTHFMTILGMDSGEIITGDGITIIKHSEQKSYNTIEELLAAEGLDVMYPSVVPNNQKITGIHYMAETGDSYVLYFVFSDNAYALQIFNYYSTNTKALYNHEYLSVNNIDYYITSINGTSYHAICQYKGFEYAIDSPNYDDLLKIINNMKG